MKKSLYILCLSLISYSATSQVKLDSLLLVWNDTIKPDTTRLNALNQICLINYLNAQPDSAFYYAQIQYNLAKAKNEKKYMAAALFMQGVLYNRKGDYSKAIDYHTQSLKIRTEINDESGLAKSLNSIGLIYESQSEYTKAIDYYNQSLQISEKLGEKKVMAATLNNLGLIYRNRGDYSKSNDCYTQSLKISEELGDKKTVAATLNNIGINYMNYGNYAEALEFYNQSLKIKEELGDKKGIASSLNNIGLIYDNQCKYSKALEFLSQSLKIKEELGDKNGMTFSLNNIGSIYTVQGDYIRAFEYFNQSLKIQEELGDKNGIAHSLYNIGLIYNKQGENEKALDNFTKGLKVFEQIGSKLGVVQSLNSIGVSFKNQGKYTKALEYFTQSMNILKEIGNNKVISETLINIGNIYYYQGDYLKALDTYYQSLKIKEELGDKNGIANTSNNIGLIYRIQGNFAKANEYCSHSYSIAKEIGAATQTKKACFALVKINILLDSLHLANNMSVALRELILKDLQLNFITLSEQQKEKYFATVQGDFDLLYDFSLRNPEFTVQSENAFDNTLLTKGLLLKSSTGMREIIQSSGDSLLTEQYNNWLALKRRISKAYTEGKSISKLEEEADELEKELVKGSQEFSGLKKLQSLTWKDVQKGLKDGESAVEFIRYGHTENYQNDSNKVNLYAALIIDNKCKHPKMVRLFEEPELEKILGTFSGNNISYIEQVYGTNVITKSQLYNLIWKPIEDELKTAKKIYISPVGLLHKISFAALVKEQNVFLCDLYDIEMKSSTGKIALPSDLTYNKYSTITLFGGINYNSDSTSTVIWNYLDGTLNETQQIAKILRKEKVKYNYFYQSKASEGQFKEIATKSNILHIATHGFFYPDPDLEQEKIVSLNKTEEHIYFRGGRSGMGKQNFVMSKNPLMRSGLAFAGANDVWNRSNIDGDDGVLTAAEVATIDMRNTYLVVLSACETGLGDIKGSEGVYGLQRSFKMSGVDYIIMSLWKIPDKETAEFMNTFYKNLIKNNDIKVSFRQTQQAMRKKYDPYYWAAFVLIE